MAKRVKIKLDKNDAKALLEAIIAGIREKKGKMIRQIDLTSLGNASTDYFIICHGDSQRQTVAIADSIEDEVRKAIGEKPWHVEGTQNAHWVLMDYVNVVVHVFYKEARDFYDIESLWSDAVITEIAEEEIKTPVVKAKKTVKSAIKKPVKPSVKKTVAKKSPVKATKKAVKTKKK